jgi:competence protein ComEC
VASPAALVANLDAVPWTSFALLPAALAATALLLLVPGSVAAELAVRGASALADASLAATLTIGARLPDPVVPPASGPVLALVAGVVVLLLWSPRIAPRIVGAFALPAALLWLPPGALTPGAPRIAFLDVGQGDATLVQGRSGTVLVDAGAAVPGGPDLGRVAVRPALGALGVRRLDLLVVSHADLDHRGGLPAVLEAFPVGAVWMPAGRLGEPGLALLADTARRRGVPVLEAGAGDPEAAVGDLRVQALWPPRDGARRSANAGSLVLRVAVAGRRVLLPGDLEAAAELGLLGTGADLAADVLKLPHHGSRTSSSPVFLAAVDPALAVASAPCAGRFGMPHAEVRARVVERGAPLWWTGRDGAVLVGLAPRLVAVGSGTTRRGCEGPGG